MNIYWYVFQLKFLYFNTLDVWYGTDYLINLNNFSRTLFNHTHIFNNIYIFFSFVYLLNRLFNK